MSAKRIILLIAAVLGLVCVILGSVSGPNISTIMVGAGLTLFSVSLLIHDGRKK